MSGAVHICSFEACGGVTRKTTYEELKARALKAGRFSVFEATENRMAAGLFTRLCGDPEIETTPAGFPWTKVKKREKVGE